MKKIVIGTALALAVNLALALEMGVHASRDFSTLNRNSMGVSVSEKFKGVGVTLGVDRFSQGNDNQNRFSLVGGYDLAKVGPVIVTPKLGVAYLSNSNSDNGAAMTAGLGVSTPVTKNVSVGLDVFRQYGQSRVSAFDGNHIAVGLKYKF